MEEEAAMGERERHGAALRRLVARLLKTQGTCMRVLIASTDEWALQTTVAWLFLSWNVSHVCVSAIGAGGRDRLRVGSCPGRLRTSYL